MSANVNHVNELPDSPEMILLGRMTRAGTVFS